MLLVHPLDIGGRVHHGATPARPVLRRRPVTARPPRQARPLLRRAALATVSTVGPHLWPLQVEGLEFVPEDGPAILAANHLSFFDSAALLMAAPRPPAFIGKVEYLDSWKTRRLLPALGMIPVDRGCGRQAWRALEVAAGVLRSGGLFAIFPEGTRSRDGSLHAGHRGVGQLSITTGAPIVPVGIIGTDRIQPPGSRAPRPFLPAVVRFGPPLRPDGYAGRDRDRRRHLTDDLMAAIAGLSGQARAGDRVSARV